MLARTDRSDQERFESRPSLPPRLILLGAFVATIMVLGLALPVWSQGSRFGLPWHSIDGGGGSSTAARFQLDGSIGQPDAGSARGERFSIIGGFQAADVRDAVVGEPIFLPVLRMRD